MVVRLERDLKARARTCAPAERRATWAATTERRWRRLRQCQQERVDRRVSGNPYRLRRHILHEQVATCRFGRCEVVVGTDARETTIDFLRKGRALGVCPQAGLDVSDRRILVECRQRADEG